MTGRKPRKSLKEDSDFDDFDFDDDDDAAMCESKTQSLQRVSELND
jgi:hypothetical protein